MAGPLFQSGQRDADIRAVRHLVSSLLHVLIGHLQFRSLRRAQAQISHPAVGGSPGLCKQSALMAAFAQGAHIHRLDQLVVVHPAEQKFCRDAQRPSAGNVRKAAGIVQDAQVQVICRCAQPLLMRTLRHRDQLVRIHHLGDHLRAGGKRLDAADVPVTSIGFVVVQRHPDRCPPEPFLTGNAVRRCAVAGNGNIGPVLRDAPFQQCKGVKRRVLLHIVLHPFGKARGRVGDDFPELAGEILPQVIGNAHDRTDGVPVRVDVAQDHRRVDLRVAQGHKKLSQGLVGFHPSFPPVPLHAAFSVPIVRVSSSRCQPFFRRFSHTEMQEVPIERAAHLSFLSLRPNML